MPFSCVQYFSTSVLANTCVSVSLCLSWITFYNVAFFRSRVPLLNRRRFCRPATFFLPQLIWICHNKVKRRYKSISMSRNSFPEAWQRVTKRDWERASKWNVTSGDRESPLSKPSWLRLYFFVWRSTLLYVNYFLLFLFVLNSSIKFQSTLQPTKE